MNRLLLLSLVFCLLPGCASKHWTQQVGKEVTLEGKVAEAIWQHMINCKGRVRLTGTVLELRGGSKRGSKIDDKQYVEYHLDVTRWECLD
jgi:hypothetical protein